MQNGVRSVVARSELMASFGVTKRICENLIVAIRLDSSSCSRVSRP